ncbi:MAG: response regulator transcription factor [Clostridiales bacterium]|nr:response regulator transcription factor [Clostridiales bacterium]
MKIYLVEDDDNIRNLVLYTLNAGGFTAEGFEEAGAFYSALKREIPDLVLLDIMLPGEDGLCVLRKLRGDRHTKKLPVIMVTAKDAEHDKVLGLDGGADDYIAKPFGMMELLSRVKALMRRAAPENEHPVELRLGNIRLLPQKREITVGGRAVSLTMKEYDLLRLLMESPGIVYSREALMERIWGYDYEGETRTVDVHIRSLRQKLRDAASVIETVRGVGYKAVTPS